jgi:hypothetical protein
MNMTVGYALLRDRRVPIRTKLIALGIGAAGVGAIELLQLPVEGFVAALLPSHRRPRGSRPGWRRGRHRSGTDRHLAVAPSRARRSCTKNPRRNGTHGTFIE